MNRRRAIVSLSVAGAGIAAAFSGFKWYQISKAPDLAFLDQQTSLIAALAETMIPATDTPGAKDTLVHEFIIKMIKDCTGKKTQNNFIDGLKDLRAYCGNNYRVSYEDLNPGQQEEVMEHYENKAKSFNGLVAKAQNMFLGKPFFHILKEYTVEGYCTSQKGATLGLNYLAVPGRFNGCTTLEPGQKAWATN